MKRRSQRGRGTKKVQNKEWHKLRGGLETQNKLAGAVLARICRLLNFEDCRLPTSCVSSFSVAFRPSISDEGS